MENLKLLLIALILFISFSCSITKNQKKGTVLPKAFNYETEFTNQNKTRIILPFKLNGVSKNFIFDNGAQYSLIQRDSLIGKIESVTGASKREMKLGTEIITSMKIGNIDFRNLSP